MSLSPDAALIAGATITTALIVPTYLWWRRTHLRKWQRLKKSEIPMWIVARVYSRGFPNRRTTITQNRFTETGTKYVYDVKVRDISIREPFARVGHLEVRRKRR